MPGIRSVYTVYRSSDLCIKGSPRNESRKCVPTHTALMLESSSSSIGTTAHCGLWPIEQCPSIFSYLPPTLSIFSLPALEDLFLLPLSIPSWVFPFLCWTPGNSNFWYPGGLSRLMQGLLTEDPVHHKMKLYGGVGVSAPIIVNLSFR